ncbi:glycosyltransferase family 4 protein [Microbispora corallina]|uniref:Glycosyl transferase n=1 Tax=Microbispora corallina TaxID=83302 RepID=A0ABQ4FZX1_9ACTN|nr:glycosyltransferase family 4 protein [Microbispora corallina]GIH40355.1 glycosyl transferase [Microbispora corallina]
MGLADTGGSREALHVAMVAPPWYEVPPKGYGGIESMLADLVRGLAARGHRVTLIGAGAGADLRTYEEPQSARIGEAYPEVVHAARAARLLRGLDADVVHDHSLAGPLGAGCRAVPTVVTCHGDVTGEAGTILRDLGEAVSLVAISLAQRAQAPDLNWVARVHNAVDVASFPFAPVKEDWVLWLGRFSPDKGADLAIEAARAAGRRIVLAGKLVEAAEREHFRERVAPLLGAGAEYVGEADGALKRGLLSRARCLVLPLRWEEPFGMVLIEAMACGTPVVAIGRGAVPEIVADGLTGFVRRDPSELPAAIEEAGRLDPHVIRAHAERRFDVGPMVEGYERVYRAVIASSWREASGRVPALPLTR